MSDINKETLTSLQQFISSRYWKFAKTYAKTAPHEYTVRSWKPDEQENFEMFSQAITKYGTDQWWRGGKWRYLIVNNFKYWTMDDVINRVEVVGNE